MVLERPDGEPLPVVRARPLADDLDTPVCIGCLHRMEAEETAAGVPYWACGSCGAGRIA